MEKKRREISTKPQTNKLMVQHDSTPLTAGISFSSQIEQATAAEQEMLYSETDCFRVQQNVLAWDWMFRYTFMQMMFGSSGFVMALIAKKKTWN